MSRSVLIVDDEQHIRLLIEQTLEELSDEGVELYTASDGEEALAAIEAQRPDLVFLDVMMPRRNGLEVAAPSAATSAWGRPHRPAHGEGPGARPRRGAGRGREPLPDEAVDPDELLAIAREVLGEA